MGGDGPADASPRTSAAKLASLHRGGEARREVQDAEADESLDKHERKKEKKEKKEKDEKKEKKEKKDRLEADEKKERKASKEVPSGKPPLAPSGDKKENVKTGGEGVISSQSAYANSVLVS